MNTPRSREGNMIRYLVYLIFFIMVALTDNLALRSSAISIWHVILFLIVAAMCSLFYVYRFKREQRFFDLSYNSAWTSCYKQTLILSVAVALIRIGVSYLQLYQGAPASGLQMAYMQHSSNLLYWFVMLANGIVLPVLEEYLCSGFLFNYWFRNEKKAVAYVGIFCSGLLYAILTFQFAPIIFAANLLLGMLFAWSYLSTQTLWLPLYLAVLNGVLTVITITI